MADEERTSQDLSDAELLELVEAALRGAGPLDRLVTRRIFGGDAPRMWRDWPKEARETWDRAMRLHADRVRRDERPAAPDPSVQRGRGRPRQERVTLERTWGAFELAAGTLCGEREEWWRIPGVAWVDLAAVLGVSRRQAAHGYQDLGWAFRGVAGTRIVLRAPCLGCGEAWPADRITVRRGPCCAEAAIARSAGGV